ncbi:MAG: DUF2309 domain-containing protein [Gammaproteobacteria bacterium]
MPGEDLHSGGDIRERLRQGVAHLEHLLPGQAAIRDFVHHNTLHGFEHLPFPRALEAARRATGNYGYLPDAQFRELYRQGRIRRDDLCRVLEASPSLKAGDVIFRAGGQPLRRLDVYLAGLLHPLKPITGSQLNWRIEERGALDRIQSDVDAVARERLLAAAAQQGQDTEAGAVEALWNACLHVLGLDHFILHPEELLDLSPEQAERMLSQMVPDEDHPEGQPMMDRLILREAERQLRALLERVGGELTLSGLLGALTGRDLLEQMRPALIRYLGCFLDQGFAAWHDADRQRGFYAVWRAGAAHDLGRIFEDLPDWADSLDALPEDPLDTVVIELRWLGLAEDEWEGYLARLALELPGWSGMFLWRHNRPGYDGLGDVRVDMMDYLAVRLVLERLYAQRLCREFWQIEASLDVIGWYFRRNLSEFLVRSIFYNQRLPEYLATLAQRQLNCSDICASDEQQWLHLAHLIWTWQRSPSSDRAEGYSVLSDAWPLFRLMQHLGLSGPEVRKLNTAQVEMILACREALAEQPAGYLWLQAYELHYRDQLFNAVAQNRGRGRWATRERPPQAQVVFCMDDREEGIRRHLEEHNPEIETLGAAGFFGVPIYWRGLDDEAATALCPVAVIPSHELRETPGSGEQDRGRVHRRRRALRLLVKDMVYQETRRNLLSTALLIALGAPAALLLLAGKLAAPLRTAHWSARLRRAFDTAIATRVRVSAAQPALPATARQPRLGFTDSEQADHVEGLLRAIGLRQGFAPLVVMMGHGSTSQNNPHLAAYDCGACSGRHGGPNARAFALMANRPEVRALLSRRAIEIPDDTWFLGAEHDTCDEAIEWYDTEAVPAALQPSFRVLRQDLAAAVLGSADERARRLASAPRRASRRAKLRHIAARAGDFSQVRPELGHATNAAAIIGRRALSRETFLDRRVFLISYDPTQDPDGDVLEGILLAAGPVGAGISLEYYFSTVNNERYGCGSKVTHNVTGLLGVMQGASDDLRTGLPRQMIEIHEAMRLQVLVEAAPEVLAAIYARQPPLKRLIGNGWILLSAIDPDSGEISVFDPVRGFEPWCGPEAPLPTVGSSAQWYAGHSEALAPSLIETPREVDGRA